MFCKSFQNQVLATKDLPQKIFLLCGNWSLAFLPLKKSCLLFVRPLNVCLTAVFVARKFCHEIQHKIFDISYEIGYLFMLYLESNS